MSDTQLELQPETLPATSPGPRPNAAEIVPEPAPADGTASTARHPAPAPQRRRSVRAKAVGFPWEVSPLAQFPMAELLAEIDRRHARAKVLIAERDRIMAKMAELEAELGIVVPNEQAVAAAGKEPRPTPRSRRQRAKNSVSLADALALAIEVRATVSPAEAAQIVISNGYQSTAKNFGMVVANALSKDSRFRRKGRGHYERVA